MKVTLFPNTKGVENEALIPILDASLTNTPAFCEVTVHQVLDFGSCLEYLLNLAATSAKQRHTREEFVQNK